ncbi:MAG: DUF2318 domain-containing protein [Rectinemataceae bacterium]|nr:DUF2318 domain-containing protein [Rectinemataceae bacterium]
MPQSAFSRMTRAIIVSIAFAVLSAPLAFSQAKEPKASMDWGIVIKKKDITYKAKFYSYVYEGKTMEIFAVKAPDGTIRTALNTCQVCYSSGRGYYVQENAVFVCQNCGNRFKLDQIEIIKGGCNPIPIMKNDKTDLGDSIGISKSYLASVSPYFARWKKK